MPGTPFKDHFSASAGLRGGARRGLGRARLAAARALAAFRPAHEALIGRAEDLPQSGAVVP